MKVIPLLQTISIVISLLLVTFAILMTLVSGAAIILSWVSLLFALLAYNPKNINILKLYGLLFIASHIPLAVMSFNRIDNQNITTPDTAHFSFEFPDFSLFEKCSNEMFYSKNDLNQKLTAEDHEVMETCLKKGSM